jgi:hypothetical protein
MEIFDSGRPSSRTVTNAAPCATVNSVPLASCRAFALYGFLRTLTGLTLSKVPSQPFDSRCDVSENQPSLQASSPDSAEIPSWKTAYEKTMWELDNEKLLALIHAAEGELFERWQELGDSPAHARERAAMKIAADDLLAIKIHKLGWPDPCQ